MSQAVGTLVDMLLQTSGSTVQHENGEVTVTPSNDLVKYRLFDIPDGVDNFSAFLKEVHDLKMLAATFDEQLTPTTAISISAEIVNMLDSYVISLTGKSAENSRLIREILNDDQRMYHFYKDLSKGKRSMFKFQGRDDEDDGRDDEDDGRDDRRRGGY